MRQRHRGLASEAIVTHPRKRGTVKGQAKAIAAATPPPPSEAKINMMAALTMRALTGLGFIPNSEATSGRGRSTVRARTVTTYVKPDAAIIARRRAANKRARAARRAHRQASQR